MAVVIQIVSIDNNFSRLILFLILLPSTSEPHQQLIIAQKRIQIFSRNIIQGAAWQWAAVNLRSNTLCSIVIHEGARTFTHLFQPLLGIEQRKNLHCQLLTFNFLQQHALVLNSIFEDHFSSTSPFHGTSIHYLVVAWQIGLGNNESRLSHCRDLIETPSTAATYYEIAHCVDVANVMKIVLRVVEGIYLLSLLLIVLALQALRGILPGVVFWSFHQPHTVNDKNVIPPRSKVGQRVHQSPIDGPRPLGTTKSENHSSALRYWQWHGLASVRA